MTKERSRAVVSAVLASLLMLALGPFLVPKVGEVIYILLVAVAIGVAIEASKRIPFRWRREPPSTDK